MSLHLRPALPEDIAAGIDVRGRTRRHAVSAARLAESGIAQASGSAQVRDGDLPGVVGQADGAGVVGDCVGDTASGEVKVLAPLPAWEGQGLGRSLLAHVVSALHARGHRRLFLGASDDPRDRSHGFYRHLGWRPTGERDGFGDEVLVFDFAAAGPGAR